MVKFKSAGNDFLESKTVLLFFFNSVYIKMLNLYYGLFFFCF